VVERLTRDAIGQAPEIPDGWFEMFSWESHPARVSPDRWPSLGEVIAQLRSQHERLRQIIGGLTEEQLDRRSAGNPNRTVRSSILHGLHDEACHSGEASLLLKMRSHSRG